MTPLYNHDSLTDFIAEIGKSADEVVIFSYLLGTNARLDPLYKLLAGKPHRIFCCHSGLTKSDAHTAALDVLLAFPALTIFTLPETHTKLWAFRRGKTWTTYVGSYNLFSSNTAQLMLKFKGCCHTPIKTHLAQRVLPMGNPLFAGVPLCTRKGAIASCT